MTEMQARAEHTRNLRTRVVLESTTTVAVLHPFPLSDHHHMCVQGPNAAKLKEFFLALALNHSVMVEEVRSHILR